MLCFPHAAGCASFFRSWQALLSSVAVHAVQYPGREERISDPAAASLIELADTVAEEILHCEREYDLFFGHSMGSYVALEVAHRLQAAGRGVPAIVVSSAAAPALRPPVPYEKTADVLEYLTQFEPLSPEIRQEPELLDIILDRVKSDLRLVSNYREYTGKEIDSEIFGIVGAEDIPGIRDGLLGWAAHTSSNLHAHTVPGNHFYLRAEPPTTLIRAALSRALLATQD
ncbi:thioesterase II family protein [Saccharopolyspora sp. NPDC000995]